MMKRTILFTLLILCFWAHALAQRFMVKSLDVTNGLSSDYVMQMAMDKYGFIWVATEEGLNRFDGSRFFSYYHVKDRNSITANELNCLLDDPQENKMWIGTQREGLNVFDYDRDEFSCYQHRANNPHSLITNDITSLSLAKDKNLWLTTYWAGLEYFDRKRERFHHFNQKTVRGLVSNQMWTAFDAGNGMVYVGHVYDGLSVIDVKSRAAYNYRHDDRNPQSISGNEVHCVFRSANGLIWVGTNKGLDLFDPLQGKFHHVADPRGTIHPVFQIKQMSDGRLWLATELGGVVIVDIRQSLGQSFGNFKFDYISEGEGNGHLGGSSVRCMLEDSYHNVWLGLYGAGIDFVSREQPLFKSVTYGQVDPVYHLSTKSVMSLAVDHHGLLWAGTDGDGLNLFDKDMARVAVPIELPGRSIQTIHCDSRGNIWIGAFSDNAYVKSSGGSMRKVFDEMQDVRCFFEDGMHMWIGTSKGLYVVDINTQKVIKHYNLKNNLVRSVVKDRLGRMWIGTFGSGLLVYDSRMRLIRQLTKPKGFPSNTVNAVIADRRGCIWCATGEGLVSFPKGDVRAFTTYAAASRLNNLHIRAVAEDEQGNLWVSTNKGISCMKRGKDYFVNYDYRDNVAMGNYNPGSVAVSASGMLYFGSTKGLTCFNPRNVLVRRQAPEVFVTAVDIPHDATFMKDSTLNLIGKQKVSLQSNENTFTIHFNVRNYALLGRIEYGYRLVGLQREWQITEENNILKQNEEELQRLRELYSLDQEYLQYKKVAARVIAKDSENWFQVFRIDKGSKDGIKVDQNVMAKGGLVGIVTDVGLNYATVRSIIDDESRVSCMGIQSSDTCIVAGDLRLYEEGRLRITNMKKDAVIQDGDRIVTSNISSKFLPGILVGFAIDIEVDEKRLMKNGYLIPAADFTNLQEVLVLADRKDDRFQKESSNVGE